MQRPPEHTKSQRAPSPQTTPSHRPLLQSYLQYEPAAQVIVPLQVVSEQITLQVALSSQTIPSQLPPVQSMSQVEPTAQVMIPHPVPTQSMVQCWPG